MGRKEIVYIDPEPGPDESPRVPFGLKLRVVGAVIQEFLTHPRTNSIIDFDVENNKVIVQRVRKSPKQK